MRVQNPRVLAFTMVEIMIVVAIIGLLAAIAIPNFVRVRQQAQINACINNLRQIDAAKQQWALEFKQMGSVVPQLSDISDYLVRGSGARVPICPASQGNTNFAFSYSINEVTNPPTCNILGSSSHVLAF